MKKNITILLLAILSASLNAQTSSISGKITDEKNQPLPFVNVFIEGSLDGTSTTNEGNFFMKTTETGVVILKASFVGYQTYSLTKDVSELKHLKIILKPETEWLQDVVIVAGNYSLKSSTLDNKDAVELVTTAGSDGDLYKSLSLLPGTQAPGTDGRLMVRGGDSRESQTFIDGMHVLSQYTATSPNSPSRGKYSMFQFEGINFSTGGYSPEYSQSLSSILPLDTKNKNVDSKFGMGIMNVNVEGNGTMAWKKGSASLSANYTDMAFYNATLYPKEKDRWDIPYREFVLRNQLIFNINKNTTLKTYSGYDKTRFRQWWEEPFRDNLRNMDYNEDNLYLNATLRTKLENNINFFIGAAYSGNKKSINSSVVKDNNFSTDEDEIHLKSKASKRFTNLYKLEIGAETYIKSYDMKYTEQERIHRTVDNNISGLFISNDLNFTNKFFLNLSARVEHSTLTKKYSILPRVALNYQVNGFTVSGIVGKYQQTTDNNYLVYNERLEMENNLMTMLGIYYMKDKKIYRAEVYNKKYDNLPLIMDGNYTSDGYGHSRGIDLYFDDRQTIKNIEYMIGYSYNDSKRKFLHYPEKATPEFVTKHNASVTLKYTNWKLKSIFGITNRFASGRPHHDPNKDGFINSTTPLYHTLDLALTVLPHRKVIVYACASNVLNRKNVYGYSYSDKADLNGKFASVPTTMYQNQSFYIGVFITLGKNVAYNASAF
jgi:hypothetical protein